MAPLGKPLREREVEGRVTIIKDMSELSAERRQQWLDRAVSKPGSWLIVSNTGPLLHSLADYSKIGSQNQDIESTILERLDQSFDEGPLDRHSVDAFKKKLVILNLTRLDNVALGARILIKLVEHSAWGQCEGCSAESACPLQLNRKAIRDAGPVAEKRVRWIYQRLSTYEHRLTLRQIVAQLAFGLTGGLSCDEAQQQVAASTVVKSISSSSIAGPGVPSDQRTCPQTKLCTSSAVANSSTSGASPLTLMIHCVTRCVASFMLCSIAQAIRHRRSWHVP
jgi:hypothetical protein